MFPLVWRVFDLRCSLPGLNGLVPGQTRLEGFPLLRVLLQLRHRQPSEEARKEEDEDLSYRLYFLLKPISPSSEPQTRQTTRVETVSSPSTVGEIRHMCINGNPVRTVITGELSTPGTIWSVEGIRSMITLREIQFVSPQSPGLHSALRDPSRSVVERGLKVDGGTVFEPNRTVEESSQETRRYGGLKTRHQKQKHAV